MNTFPFIIKSFWKSRNLFSKRFLAAGGNIKKGIAAIEAMVMVLILFTIFTVAVPLFLGSGDIKRQNQTIDRLNHIKIAMIGDRLNRENKTRSSFGFLGDLGVLPGDPNSPYNRDGFEDLVSNSSSTGGVVYPGWRQDGYTGLWYGWRGPYIDDTRDINGNYVAFMDSWGKAIRYRSLSGGQIVWDAELRSAGPDGVFDNSDDLFVTIGMNETATYAAGTFKDRAKNPVVDSKVTVYYPDGGGNLASVEITTGVSEPGRTAYSSEIDSVSPSNKRLFPLGIRYIETTDHQGKQWFAFNEGAYTSANFVFEVTVATSTMLWERTNDSTDDTASNPYNILYGNWTLNSSGDLVTTGSSERRIVFGLGSWDNYRIETDATLDSGGSAYGVYYRALLNVVNSDIYDAYCFKFDPLLYDLIQDPPVPHPPGTNGRGISFAFSYMYHGTEIDWEHPLYVKEYLQYGTTNPTFPTFPYSAFGRSHHISVTVKGDEHIIKVDSRQELRFTHSSSNQVYRTAGMCGLRAWNNETVRFHNIRVYGIPPLSTGEVAWWSFEEGPGENTLYGSGFLIDAAENNGTLVSGVTRVPHKYTGNSQIYSVYGQALSFNGAGQVVIPNAAILTPSSKLSVEAWVLTNDDKASSNIIDKGSYGFWQNNNNSPTSGGWNAKIQTAGMTVPLDICWGGTRPVAYRWYHLVLTYDGTYARFYVDGVLRNSAAVSGAVVTSSNNLVFGSTLFHNEFKGIIDEVVLYNKALNASEVLTRYNKYKGNL